MSYKDIFLNEPPDLKILNQTTIIANRDNAEEGQAKMKMKQNEIAKQTEKSERTVQCTRCSKFIPRNEAIEDQSDSFAARSIANNSINLQTN
jgi:Pyruvate/2-oxoacid:ferredoxin oxidoreductase delta subunit